MDDHPIPLEIWLFLSSAVGMIRIVSSLFMIKEEHLPIERTAWSKLAIYMFRSKDGLFASLKGLSGLSLKGDQALFRKIMDV